MEVRFLLDLTKGQKEAYDLIHKKDIQYLVLRWSRQCGKSVLAEVLLIEYLFKRNTFNAYVSPSFQLGRKVYSEITKMLETSGIIKKANASTLTIETIYNSTLQFFSMEAYTSIRGFTCSGILILDECGYYPDILPNGEEPWGNILMPITKARNPKIVFISTPRGKRGMFYEMYQRAVNGDKGYAEISRTIYDDELVNEDEIEEIKKSVSDLAWRQEFLVEFLDDGLSFFQGFDKCFDINKPHNTKCWIGIDCSGNGSDATVCASINEQGEYEFFEATGTLDMKYRQIAEYINKKNPVAVYGEQNGLGSPMLNEIKKLVQFKNKIYDWTTTNSSKEEIISELAVAIANKDVHFQKDDKKTFEELSNFVVTVSKTKKLTFAARGSGHDDRVMASAIALKCRDTFRYVGNPNLGFVKIRDIAIR